MGSLIHTNNCVVHGIFLLVVFSTVGPLDRELFALQECNTRRNLLFEPASGPRAKAHKIGYQSFAHYPKTLEELA